MKIKKILKEKTLVYTLFFDHLYIPIILFALFFYCSSYLLGLSGFDCQGFLYDFLCKRKFEEFQSLLFKLLFNPTSHFFKNQTW